MTSFRKKMIDRARRLRREMTDAERLLWSRLRRKQLKGLKFTRQKLIGRFIVDFCCHSAALIIEVDGGQHYDKKGMEKDWLRDLFLMSRGFRVLRFSNMDVLQNIDGVMERIAEEVEPPSIPPSRGEGK